MSMASLERAILAGARFVFKNPKLRLKDIQEWSTGPITAHTGEVVAQLPDPSVYVAILAINDKRKQS